jgi:hypothetical protein
MRELPFELRFELPSKRVRFEVPTSSLDEEGVKRA